MASSSIYQMLRFLDDSNGSGTMLHLAASRWNPSEVRNLLSARGSEINARRSDGKTPLMLAVARNCYETVEAFLNFGANIDIDDHNGQSAVKMAFELIDTKSAIVLLFLHRLQEKSYGVAEFINRLCDAGCTLYHAAFLGDVTVMEAMMERGLNDVAAIYLKGRTALHAAVESNSPSVVSWLLNNGAKVNAPDSYGVSALCLAAICGFSSIVRLLLERGADPNSKAFRSEFTPLIATFQTTNAKTDQEYDKCTEILLRHGAVPSHTVGDYPTVIDEALNRGNFKRILLLISCEAMRTIQGLSSKETILRCNVARHQQQLMILQGYYESCQQKLKTTVFEELTLLDLLLASERQFRSYMRKQSFCDKVVCFLINNDMCSSYAYYYNIITDRITKTPGAFLEDEAVTGIGKVFSSNYNQCYVFARQVIDYLDMQDLKHLSRV